MSDKFKNIENKDRIDAVAEAIKDKAAVIGQHGISAFTQEEWAKYKVELEQRKLN